MPRKKSEYVQEQLTTRVDFPAEERAATAVLRGMGLNSGKPLDYFRSVLRKLTPEAKLDTNWEVAAELLRISMVRSSKWPPAYSNVLAARVEKGQTLAARLREVCPPGGDQRSIVFLVTSSAVAAGLVMYHDQVHLMIPPPYWIEVYDLDQVCVLKWAGDMVEGFGPYTDVLSEVIRSCGS